MESKKKRQYGKWSPQEMQNALKEYRDAGDTKLNQICKKYEIPKKTFLRHARGEVREASNEKTWKINGRNLALPKQIEADLVRHVMKLEESFFGLTIADIRKLAFDILEANRLPNRFNKDKGLAGKKWFYGFMARHPELSLRQPENVSIARCKGFNKDNVYNFFDLLERLVDEYKFDAVRIFNVDESGYSTVQKKSPRVIAQKGKKQVGAVASGERGVNTTFVVCTSVSGNFVPPMIIFKRARMSPCLSNGAPPGSITEISETGYINSELFVKWLKHFISYVKPSLENKVLLLLDGHSTHAKNLEAINVARDNGVVMLQLPGHTTHRLQPLDVAIFKPMETFYQQAVTKWLRTNPGKKVTQFEVAALLNEAYEKSATLANAASGFRKSGIWPVDRTVFSESDFAPGEIMQDSVDNTQRENMETTKENDKTEYQKTDEDKEKTNEDQKTDEDKEKTNEDQKTDEHKEKTNEDQKTDEHKEKTNEDQNIQSLDCSRVSVEEICPIPKGNKTYQKRISKGAQKAEVLTESPYKNELETKKRKSNAAKRKVLQDTHEPSCSNAKSKPKKQKIKKSNVEITFNQEDWLCFLCSECSIEDMIQCQQCSNWAHESCAGYSKKERTTILTFICDLCQNV